LGFKEILLKQVVINNCYGGFGLSKEAILMYCEHKGLSEPKIWNSKVFGFFEDFNEYKIDREDPSLIYVIRTLGNKVNNSCSNLIILDIPDDVEYIICENVGKEWVAEKHRTWS